MYYVLAFDKINKSLISYKESINTSDDKKKTTYIRSGHK